MQLGKQSSPTYEKIQYGLNRKQTVRQFVVANKQGKSVACLKFISYSELLKSADVLTGS